MFKSQQHQAAVKSFNKIFNILLTCIQFQVFLFQDQPNVLDQC